MTTMSASFRFTVSRPFRFHFSIVLARWLMPCRPAIGTGAFMLLQTSMTASRTGSLRSFSFQLPGSTWKASPFGARMPLAKRAFSSASAGNSAGSSMQESLTT
ncbi:MAG: hypothetical protein QM765_42525 [Myxococcales bacterium]